MLCAIWDSETLHVRHNNGAKAPHLCSEKAFPGYKLRMQMQTGPAGLKVIIAHWSTRPRAAALSSHTRRWEESALRQQKQKGEDGK